tara:strand:+ start:40 stop:525 length:486 start_codon:yes stop_codon:yes gene_type:complete
MKNNIDMAEHFSENDKVNYEYNTTVSDMALESQILTEKLEQYKACMLSILDTLKLHDNEMLSGRNETLSEIMFRKMRAYDIDLNKDLGTDHLKPVIKNLKPKSKFAVGELVELVPNFYGETGIASKILSVDFDKNGNSNYKIDIDNGKYIWVDRDFVNPEN